MISRHLATTPDPNGRLATPAGALTATRPSDHGVCVRVGRHVRDIRQALGWRQKTLGRSAGIHQGPIGASERGTRRPSLERRCDLAQAFAVAKAHLVKMPAIDAGEG